VLGFVILIAAVLIFLNPAGGPAGFFSGFTSASTPHTVKPSSASAPVGPNAVPGTPAPSIEPFVGVQGDIPDVSTINGDPDLRNHVLMTGCSQTAGGWEGTGTANNTTPTQQTYEIVVIFTDSLARSVTSAKTQVTVQPGATQSWTAAATYNAPAGSLCVLAGVDTSN
jgi:hypothetical protein